MESAMDFETWAFAQVDFTEMQPWDLAKMAYEAGQAAERERIKARLLGMDDAAAGRHNYYAHAAWVLFDRKA